MLGHNPTLNLVTLKISSVSQVTAKRANDENFISHSVTVESPCFKAKNSLIFSLHMTSGKYWPKKSFSKSFHFIITIGFEIKVISHQWMASLVN